MTAKKDTDANTETVKALDTEQKARVKASDEANKQTLANVKHADTTDKQVADEGEVSKTEHASGFRQPAADDAEVETPLGAVDIPQIIVVAKNDSDVPGETGKLPKGAMTHAEAAQVAHEHHSARRGK